MTAEHRGWGKGWPTNRAADMQRVTAGGVTIPVHKTIAELVAYLLAETVRRGYQLKAGQCWGYANRAVTGSNQVPSNHSWGLAVDLNAPTNPYRKDGRLVTDMPAWMPALWKAWGFTWGGDYKGAKDAMHYEFLGTPDQARALTEKMRDRTPAVTTTRPPKMEVPPMYNPPIDIAGRVVATLKAPGGGMWMLTEPGAIYAWECDDYGAPNRHPEYWQPNQRGARLEPLTGGGYRVVDSEGHFYEYRPGA